MGWVEDPVSMDGKPCTLSLVHGLGSRLSLGELWTNERPCNFFRTPPIRSGIDWRSLPYETSEVFHGDARPIPRWRDEKVHPMDGREKFGSIARVVRREGASEVHTKRVLDGRCGMG